MQRDEAFMRAHAGKRQAFEKLASTRFLRPVAAAHRAYLAAAVDDVEATERDFWTMSCLPSTTERRLSAISMRFMEVCVLHAPEDVEAGAAAMFVIVRRSVLAVPGESNEHLGDRYPGLTFSPSEYRDAGTDQIRASGWHDDLVEALHEPRFALSARVLAEHLLTGQTVHWEGHNYELADTVLRRER
ncbi:hypothetical protein [Paractinoplanes atraurantiacus]|nr:hypothetical protein [Actinoplanes atraurantiacus]